jgi:hypothetical protein
MSGGWAGKREQGTEVSGGRERQEAEKFQIEDCRFKIDPKTTQMAQIATDH